MDFRVDMIEIFALREVVVAHGAVSVLAIRHRVLQLLLPICQCRYVDARIRLSLDLVLLFHDL